jgi:asparagine synthase (glutamine-hydrolysing)
MSTFADFLIEFGPRRSAEGTPKLPFRGSPWGEVSGDFGPSRLFLSTPRVAGLTENAAGAWTAWTFGEVGIYGDKNGSTGKCVDRFLNDLQNGTAKPETLGGRFLVLGWSAQTRCWSVWTDRMGSVQAYFVDGRDGMALGTYSPAIYSYSRRNLDWVGLSSFFSLGFFVGDRTHYEDCKILRPASRYQYDAFGKLAEHTSYWQWRHTPDTGRNEADTIAEFADRFANVVDRQTSDGRVALPLSGGLDSRTVAACLPSDRRVSAYSYGFNDDSIETSISRDVAAAAGLSFHSHTIRPYLFEKLGLVLQSVEGFQDVTQSRQADVSEWLHQQSDCVIGAHWGDVLCDDMGVDRAMTPTQQLDKLECKMRKKGGDWLLQNLCAKNVNGYLPAQLVRADLKKEWESHASIEDPDFRAKAVKSTQWAFRWTLPSIRMYQPGAMPRLPFLEPSILDFFCTVPTTMVLGRRLQIEYLKRFAPHLARVRWQAYDADLFHYQHFGTWQLPKRAWKALQRAVAPQNKFRRNWEVQFQPPGQVEKLESLLCANGLFLHEVVDAATVRTEFEKFVQSPDASNGYIVSMLLTFSSWAESVHVESRSL